MPPIFIRDVQENTQSHIPTQEMVRCCAHAIYNYWNNIEHDRSKYVPMTMHNGRVNGVIVLGSFFFSFLVVINVLLFFQGNKFSICICICGSNTFDEHGF